MVIEDVTDSGTRTAPLSPLLERERRRAEIRLPQLGAGWYVAVEDGSELTLLPLPEGSLHVGRSPAAGLCFDDASVSRRHAVLVLDGDVLRVLDDRSLNGTFVNGERVDARTLEDGDVIEVGRQRLRAVRVPAAT